MSANSTTPARYLHGQPHATHRGCSVATPTDNDGASVPPKPCPLSQVNLAASVDEGHHRGEAPVLMIDRHKDVAEILDVLPDPHKEGDGLTLRRHEAPLLLWIKEVCVLKIVDSHTHSRRRSKAIRDGDDGILLEVSSSRVVDGMLEQVGVQSEVLPCSQQE